MDKAQIQTLYKLRDLIAASCQPEFKTQMSEFHIKLIKFYYDATDVRIDYERCRIELNMLIYDGVVKTSSIHHGFSVLPFNLSFVKLERFLMRCIAVDTKTVVFYGALLKRYGGMLKELRKQTNNV